MKLVFSSISFCKLAAASASKIGVGLHVRNKGFVELLDASLASFLTTRMNEQVDGGKNVCSCRVFRLVVVTCHDLRHQRF